MQRGIVASNTGIASPMGVEYGRGASADELRYFLLYWDRIIVPQLLVQNGGIRISTGTNELQGIARAELLDAPISPHGVTHLSDVGSYFARQAQEASPDTIWTVHQIADEYDRGSNQRPDENAVRISLANCLPAPSADVNIYEIEEFRALRQDEFDEFHLALDQLYLSIVDSSDQLVAENLAMKQLSDAVTSIDRYMSERWSVLNRFAMSPAYKWTKKIADFGVVAAASAGALGGVMPELNIDVTKVLGSGLTLSRIRLSLEKMPSISDKYSSHQVQLLNYLSSAAREGVIDSNAED